MKIKRAYTYDDLLLVPKHSEILSRSNVDLSVKFPKGFSFSSPLIPANMRDVVDENVARVFVGKKHLTLLHRFDSEDPLIAQVKIARAIKKAFSDAFNFVGCSIGTAMGACGKDLFDFGFKILCIDVAHGDSKQCVELAQLINKNHPDCLLIAGNVATGEGAKRLFDAGVDVVKVGIGNGQICTTRKETGNGVPQMTALEEVAYVRDAQHKDCAIIADGGIRSAGDCVKALCFADAVMIGGMFASTDNSPGDMITINGQRLKKYHGSSTHKDSRREGTVVLNPSRGSLWDVITNIEEGIQSGCSYQNCLKVSDLQKDPVFVEVSSVQQSLDHNKETLRT